LPKGEQEEGWYTVQQPHMTQDILHNRLFHLINKVEPTHHIVHSHPRVLIHLRVCTLHLLKVSILPKEPILPKVLLQDTQN